MSALTLCELLGFVVQRVDHFAHVLYRLQRRLVRLVHHRLLEDDQHSFTLVQNTCVRDTQRFLSSVHPGNKKKKSAKCKVTAAKRCGQASTKHGQVRQKFTVRVKGVRGGGLTVKLLVQDHLRQLPLHVSLRTIGNRTLGIAFPVGMLTLNRLKVD